MALDLDRYDGRNVNAADGKEKEESGVNHMLHRFKKTVDQWDIKDRVQLYRAHVVGVGDNEVRRVHAAFLLTHPNISSFYYDNNGDYYDPLKEALDPIIGKLEQRFSITINIDQHGGVTVAPSDRIPIKVLKDELRAMEVIKDKKDNGKNGIDEDDGLYDDIHDIAIETTGLRKLIDVFNDLVSNDEKIISEISLNSSRLKLDTIRDLYLSFVVMGDGVCQGS